MNKTANREEIRKTPAVSIRHFPYDFIKWTAVPAAWLMVRPKRIYESKEAKKRIRGGALLISNHVGFMDPVYLMTAILYRRHHYVCIKDFFERKVVGFFFRIFQCIPIDREHFSTESFRAVVNRLRAGDLVVMFPEGRINFETDSTESFKSGMILMAVRAGVPIVPVYTEKREHWYNRVRVAVGEPVDIKALYAERPTFSRIEELASLLHRKEDALCRICQNQKKEKSDDSNGGDTTS
ncbi:MAG: 1-acyl-sn-glycerol-3-phosphate acyltransferase [Clostridia bacterium]|nr:1-acyl-sn-glycerol-3-phosphate acyltransferase [Clostridia bacterium]